MPGEIAGKVAGYGGSGTALVSGASPERWQEIGFTLGLTPTEWQAIGVAGGLLLGVLGFALNAWLGWRRDRREERARGRR